VSTSEIYLEADVEIARVAFIWSAAEGTTDVFACTHRQWLGNVEDRLLPMRVFGGRGCTKHDRLVNLTYIYINKQGPNSVHCLLSFHT
jgi:hypothetical protein